MERDVVWESLRWPDGTLYQGLTRQGRMHRSGVLTHSNGDRYEGEFEDGRMQGHGVYIWRDGTVYRGQWEHDVAHGCGVKLWRRYGVNGDRNGSNSNSKGDSNVSWGVEEGKFLGDEYVGPVMACSVSASHEAAVEADVSARMAREWLTGEGRSAQTQVLARTRNSGLASGAGTRTHTQRATGATQGQPTTQQHTGWRFRWPWEPAHSDTPQPHTHNTNTPHTAHTNAHMHQANDSSVMGRVTKSESRVQKSESRVPGVESDIGFKTRPIKESEVPLASALVDHLMAKALREHQAMQQQAQKAQ